MRRGSVQTWPAGAHMVNVLAFLSQTLSHAHPSTRSSFTCVCVAAISGAKAAVSRLHTFPLMLAEMQQPDAGLDLLFFNTRDANLFIAVSALALSVMGFDFPRSCA
jgi:hypothetical protein